MPSATSGPSSPSWPATPPATSRARPSCATAAASRACEQRRNLGGEGVHLVQQLLERSIAKSDLDVADSHARVLVEALSELLCRAGDRASPDVPGRLAHVEHLGDDADVDRLVAERRLAVLEEVGDRLGHLGPGGALGEPAVAPLGSAPECRPGRPADPAPPAA